MSESKSNSKVVNSAKNMISVMRVKQQTDISPRAREKGAAKIWTTPPNEKFGFVFKAKADFWDALALRYHRSISNLQPTCACGKPYSLDHSQICKTDGFIHMRHDDPVTLLAQEARQVFNVVQVEPSLAPLTGEDLHALSANRADNARSDLAIRGFLET